MIEPESSSKGITGQETTATGIRLIREALPPRWKLYALSVICMLGVAGFTGALAYSTRLIVNDVFVAGDAKAAYSVALLVVAVAFGKAFSVYANAVVKTVFKRSVISHYQKLTFRRLVLQETRFFADTHASMQMAQLKLFGNACGSTVVGVTNTMFTDIMTVTVLFGVMFFQDPLMTLLCSMILPVIFLTVTLLSRRVRELASAERALDGAYFAVGAETFEGIKTVKVYGLESKSVGRFEGAVTALEDRMLSIARITSATSPLMEFLGGIVIGLFVIYAAWQTMTFGKTPGEFTAFITAFLMAYQPASRLSKVWVDIQKSLVHTGRMYKILDRPIPLQSNGAEVLAPGENSISFEDVSFEYEKGAPALRNVSVDIKAGEKVAIIGRSGSGKSTLIDLVLRFYDPTSGTIRIGGYNATDISNESMRASTALISQDVFLFDSTILENIRDGNAGASDEDVERAARRAALTETLDNMPAGLQTVVGPNGSALSGGQKQRIGIARALVKNADICVFDEATSALDVETEQQVLESVTKELENKTVLFVTHRPATLDYVDRILLLDDGRLVSIGTKEELESGSEQYRALLNIAMKGS
ncbi:ABC transporter ATP-binding protein [uncultured Tateyamaria sp.]|uniref:ABC transporter ATP-binding protein n=1 Tax=uncultured Tateyamaria sp. TaxID=455651 RepID=UPI00262C6269|nr:ABC transporter ATP-binding protein [uncultured Tateyamaria sp.]